MKQIVLFLSILIASGIMFANIYTSLIDARSWGSDIPNSIATSRDYFKVVNPGNFFRLFSPINQVLAIIALVIFWKSDPSLRIYLGGAALLYVLVEVMTFGYFYPRNEIMFNSGSLADTALLKKTWNEWTRMNWVRTFILLIGIAASFFALTRSYLNQRTASEKTVISNSVSSTTYSV